MKNAIAWKALGRAILFLAFCFTPQFAFAQRGGHGGGGFHGGGGGFHGGGYGGGGHYGGGYHGGAAYSGYRGGFYGGGYHNGWHGGYYPGGWHGGYYPGWRGGYWGYPGWGRGGWGWGWGVSIGFGWGWPSFPYVYGYPAYPAPCYPYYSYGSCYPPAYTSSNTTPSPSNADYASADHTVSGEPDENPQYRYAPQPDQPVRSIPAPNRVTITNASYTASGAGGTVTSTAPNLKPVSHTVQADLLHRPEVQRAVAALRGMPPAARERQLERYTNLTPAEVGQVRAIVGLPTSR